MTSDDEFDASKRQSVVAFASELDSIFSLDDDLVKDPPGDESHTQLPELTSTVEDNARVNELDKKLKAKRQTLGLKNRELEELKERIRQLEEQEENALGKPADDDDRSTASGSQESSADDEYEENDNHGHDHDYNDYDYNSNHGHNHNHDPAKRSGTVTASMGLEAR